MKICEYCGGKDYRHKSTCEILFEKTANFMVGYLPGVKQILRNGAHTILIFKTGEKSVVKCEQKYDIEKAILYAWAKHHKKFLQKMAQFEKRNFRAAMPVNLM
jgi:hypothetical protein